MENPPEFQDRRPPVTADLTEKSKYFDEHPEEVRPEDMNNFLLWMPGSGYKENISGGKSFSEPRNKRASDIAHSELWRNQSAAEFFDLMEKAFREAPIDHASIDPLMAARTILPQQISNIEKSLEQKPDPETAKQLRTLQQRLIQENSELPQKLRQALIPLYQYLRQQGYTHYDLVG